jgi:hypothetical protein
MIQMGRRAIRETLKAATVVTALVGSVLGAGPAPAAPPEPAKAEKISPAEVEARRQALRDYFAKRRARLPIVATTRTEKGQVIDWVPRDSQYPGLKVAAPPKTDPMPALERKGERLSGFELARQPQARGPAGTVPILRRDDFIERIVPPPTVADFLSKYGLLGGDLEQPGGGPLHEYVWTEQTVPNLGGQAGFNVWDSYVHSTDLINAQGGEFNLAQVAVKRRAAAGLQTVEAGWQNYPNLNGDGFPHFFTFFTTVGYGGRPADNVSGYNREVDGWVQTSTTVFPGALLDFSAYNGDQVVIWVRVLLDNGKWWIRLNDEWVGYYPATLFASPGLRDPADQIAFYGEIVNQPDGGYPFTLTDMGSGEFASQGFGKAAFIRNAVYVDVPSGAFWYYNPGDIDETEARCYTIDAHFLPSAVAWATGLGSYFYYGGPGYSFSCP